MTGHRLDQETAERLLSGPLAGPAGGTGPLVALLTAVRAAADPAELRGESAAMAAFRAARADTLRTTSPAPPHRAQPDGRAGGQPSG
ncbi:hypothetical protein GA0070216_107278 [Micromonospora matsumotoense]|uniref:Uncharacterized protein n=1 Tax=Micromonospora matsumotoense TaxID=121616 RepID=A0A1C4YY52_9ACTN|nr:hypothetical protein [Micromonospora matsumotoense]SCF25567.1 hypothetical protein GA0070216_107278 [Micromonospora matsumotoense]